jgi:hypothetical protein
MTTLQAQIPDYIFRQITILAERERTPVDQIVAMALSAHLSLILGRDYLEQRAARGSWERAKEALSRVPDVEPADYDKLPDPKKPNDLTS